MIRSRLVFPHTAAVLAVVLVLGPARAADPEVKVDDTKRMVELLEKIEKRLGNQQAQTEVLMEIVRKDLKDLREEVSRLQRDLADVRARATQPGTTTSNYPAPVTPPVTTPITPPVTTPSFSISAPPTATVRLINRFFTDMTAIVNGQVVTVPPGGSQTITVPAGLATVQVLQVPEPARMRTLLPNETRTFTLGPV